MTNPRIENFDVKKAPCATGAVQATAVVLSVAFLP